MKRYEGIYGFIASDPDLTYNADGKPRLYIRIGINHFQSLPSGRLNRLPPTYHDLVQFDRAAELSHERFQKGDEFAAIGYLRQYDRTVDGQPKKAEQFVAYRLMHDPNTTTYEVHRRPRNTERDAAASGPDLQNRSAPAQAPASPPQAPPSPPPPPPPAPSADGLGR
ncbi:single-stranded DNA-binding protein [Jiangella endophytica]|uniref:single-stranded DNA-binding protein n=1 Tax=Jiangella endophytica TaxID=1623398 RepID=UPI000E34895C|nr:single-stranded DNA-binding protein [Jiangella endophytica]